MEALLRKYKISKISDNSLTSTESYICEVLDKNLLNIEIKYDKHTLFFIENENILMEYRKSYKILFIYKILLDKLLHPKFLHSIKVNNIIIKSLIMIWVSDIYDIEINIITRLYEN